MLRKNLKISDTTKREFFELIFFRVIKESEINTAVQIYLVVWPL